LLQEQLGSTEIEVKVEPESLEIHADRGLLDQLLINLVKNAVDALAATEQPQITLRARLDYGRTLIQVEDNGPGIPESTMDQVFIPFYTTKRHGSGIGLSLSRQIMTAHGGEIALDSRPGKTTVSLVF
jgi:signal transduction histidine kinase